MKEKILIFFQQLSKGKLANILCIGAIMIFIFAFIKFHYTKINGMDIIKLEAAPNPYFIIFAIVLLILGIYTFMVQNKEKTIRGNQHNKEVNKNPPAPNMFLKRSGTTNLQEDLIDEGDYLLFFGYTAGLFRSPRIQEKITKRLKSDPNWYAKIVFLDSECAISKEIIKIEETAKKFGLYNRLKESKQIINTIKSLDTNNKIKYKKFTTIPFFRFVSNGKKCLVSHYGYSQGGDFPLYVYSKEDNPTLFNLYHSQFNFIWDTILKDD